MNLTNKIYKDWPKCPECGKIIHCDILFPSRCGGCPISEMGHCSNSMYQNPNYTCKHNYMIFEYLKLMTKENDSLKTIILTYENLINKKTLLL